jgi:hypothetical protein
MSISKPEGHAMSAYISGDPFFEHQQIGAATTATPDRDPAFVAKRKVALDQAVGSATFALPPATNPISTLRHTTS